MSNISIIAAMSDNRVIGRDNKIPWYIPEDLAWFKQHTLCKPVIMGRKTHESIGRKLPGRPNIVISANKDYSPIHSSVAVFNDLDSAIKAHSTYDEIFIIGGEQIYKQSMSLATKIYITRVAETIDGDTFFPNIDTNIWHMSERRMSSGNNHIYEFQVFERTIP
jgi:dihydrofolate reductase